MNLIGWAPSLPGPPIDLPLILSPQLSYEDKFK